NYIKRFLTLIILQMQRNEINQSVYYTTNIITREVPETSDQNIELNDNQGEINIDDENSAKEPFIVTNKYSQNQSIEVITNYTVLYLYLFKQEADFKEENLTILKQKITYGNISSIYKKVLNKALQSKKKSQELMEMLQDFVENDIDDWSDLEDMQRDNHLDKENIDPSIYQLQNPKVRHDKGHPVSTKRYKSKHEVSKVKANQRRCKKYKCIRHYQKNCEKD
ncbi:15047_t:CDS:2, partial [Funneliformis caledonium]